MKQKRIIITPYKMGSRGAKALQQALKETTDRRVLRVRKTSTKYKQRASDLNIEWGNAQHVTWANYEQEEAKAIARDKLKTFRKFKEHEISHPEWTTDSEIATGWVRSGIDVVGRKLLRGSSGRGIVLFNNTDAVISHCPLYVKYKKKKHEYRVHVFNGTVIDVTQKKKRAGCEDVNYQVRNHHNGWVYCRDNIQEPEELRALAIAACNCIGLAYGAVDIIWNEKENKCYCLEINTAPGLEGTTLEKYSQAFKGLL